MKTLAAAIARVSGTAPPEVLAALEEILWACAGSGVAAPLAQVLALLERATATRAPSGIYDKEAEGAIGRHEHDAPITPADGDPAPDLVRVHLSAEKVAFGIPDRENGVWKRLKHARESRVLDRLLRASGTPVRRADIPELHLHHGGDIIGRINDQFVGGRTDPLIHAIHGRGGECVVYPIWSVVDVHLERVRGMDQALLNKLGAPTAKDRLSKASEVLRSSRRSCNSSHQRA